MTTVVFAANNKEYRSRLRAHRACLQCKRRRRRCEPPFENHDRCAGCARDGIACSLVPASTSATRPAPSPPPLDADPPRPRFVGDLNPESVFLTSATPQQRDLTDVGVWSATPDAPAPRPIPPHIPPPYLGYLDSIGAFALPPPRTREGLIQIYFDSVHPILPLLNEGHFRAQHAESTVSTPLLHAVLLVAARHPAAAKHLPAGQSARSFASATADKILALLHINIERDRVTLVRIHGLLALHSEGPSGNEAASLQLSTALHHAYSLGLHLSRASPDQDEQTLWWSLWVLDSLQASLCGRPVGVRREDISVPLPPAGLTPAFDAALNITHILGSVIALYRPLAKDAGWEQGFPAMETVIPLSFHGEVADALRLFYHAVAILSHRSNDPAAGSASYLRRLDSASSILRLCSQRRDWPPLPVVPYAVSLALTTFYLVFRRNGEGGREGCIQSCEILESLGAYWWFAGAMARMGRAAMERVAVKEAAGVLTGLGGGEVGGQGMVEGDAGDVQGDGLEAWFLQFFPDLANPTGWGWGGVASMGPPGMGPSGMGSSGVGGVGGGMGPPGMGGFAGMPGGGGVSGV
ncbi:hypothetical protein FPQ18DRAFT_297096 [Pyronema domesticum]|uniref:Similar to Acetamidase regulatory protein acc. no. Q4WK35 n=1 Tax=Pyronema omphalodes (strain CBS 100304) TaxID=1076935 RepID=U4LRJ0_PYROM|nr:hypothetical protein FPQ18DRAFT_297096 [Pyronema domesticum]CCX34781.1 Similar to Acetamidase regulatory protein; acc. no. Q4WK35 [Pyronema omphalodes CBS 100304]